jgi:CRP-like cAMP-binding protein
LSLDIHGRSTQNKLLLALPSAERARILPQLEFVTVPIATVLAEVEETIKFAYFVDDGLASFLRVMNDGKSVEVGLCGREGFVGIPLLSGFTTSSNRVIMQVKGAAFRMKAKDFVAALPDCPVLAKNLQRFSQIMTVQSEQGAACNRLHEVDERLARWLLMSQDRLEGNSVPLTQEFLAHMLGTRRASVTVAASVLQRAGLIRYSRGDVKIENRAKLEEASCECYAVIARHAQKWREQTE